MKGNGEKRRNSYDRYTRRAARHCPLPDAFTVFETGDLALRQRRPGLVVNHPNYRRPANPA